MVGVATSLTPLQYETNGNPITDVRISATLIIGLPHISHCSKLGDVATVTTNTYVAAGSQFRYQYYFIHHICQNHRR